MPIISVIDDAVLVLGKARVAEIRANVDDLLKHVLANWSRYARKQPHAESETRMKAA